MYVDSHCHLSSPDLLARLSEIRAEMQEARVGRALCICTTLEEFDQVHALALTYDNFWASAGVHPDNEGVAEPSVEDLLALAALPRVVALGETGLDYFRLNGRSVADMEWQRERFRIHIRAAQRTGLPLVIHTRSASQDTLDVLTADGDRRVGGVFHCFTETMDVARAALDLGFYISFSGIITFKNAEDLRTVARYVPLDRCLIETDSPYLAPAPFRGKTNTPALLPWVAKQMAELKGVAVEDFARITSANFECLFRISADESNENT
ncbi:MAG: TatD family hydrolase [Pseudomonadota bacterium]|nr:TatD family hydrolase [Pseudomonadota bacterium]